MRIKTNRLRNWAAASVAVAVLSVVFRLTALALVPVIGSLISGTIGQFGNLVSACNGCGQVTWTPGSFTQGSWMAQGNEGGSNLETDFINYATSGTQGWAWFAPNTSSLGSPVMTLSKAGTLTVAQLAGNSATSTLATTATNATNAASLSGSLTQCPNGATGIAANGNAVCISSTYKIQGLAIASGICTTTGSETKCDLSPVSWPTAFSNSSYQATCTYAGSPTGTGGNPGLYGPYVVGQTATTITVEIQAGSNSAGGDNTVAGISCIGVHN